MRIIWNPIKNFNIFLTHTHIFSDIAGNTYDDFSSFIGNYRLHKWQFNLNGIYRDQDKNALENQDSYFVANAKISYQLKENVRLYLKGTNIFDYRYATYESDVSSTFFNEVPNKGVRLFFGMETTWK